MCQSCNELNINGINCHEQGCPDSWMDAKYECNWCGGEFVPDEKHQMFCCESCAIDYYN